MKQVVSKGLVLFTIILPPAANTAAQPKFTCPIPMSMEQKYAKDPRLALMKKFFAERQCPVEKLSVDFLAASDTFGLDWRLLPSISFIESTGGKAYKNNNIFGWDNGDVLFPTISAGILTVAEELATSHFYKGKSLDQKLSTYNRYPFYGPRVKMVMAQLGPDNPGSVN